MAREVLVTGATGTLGRKVVGAATAAGHHVRAMSRRGHVGYTGVHWTQGDLLADTGVAVLMGADAGAGTGVGAGVEAAATVGLGVEGAGATTGAGVEP